jgi:hypothetical protein
MYSLNKLLVEAYVNEGLKAKQMATGFIGVQQKLDTKPLKVLVDAKLADGKIIQKGTLAHVKEEFLMTSPAAKKILESEKIEGKFIVIDISNVEFFE